MRRETNELVASCLEAERAYHDVYDAAYDRRADKKGRELADRFAVHSEEWHAYHAAVERLREWCDLAPDAAIAELYELAADQVAADRWCDEQLAETKGAADRDHVRRLHTDERCRLFYARDELSCGLGWPHRGEVVIVDQPDYQGEGLYNSSYSTMNTTHTVAVEFMVDTELHVDWQPRLDCGAGGKAWGPADPVGGIPLRLAAAPDRPLIAPVPRWPDEEWLEAIAARRLGRICEREDCGRPIPADARKDAKHCGKRCRQAAFRARRRQRRVAAAAATRRGDPGGDASNLPADVEQALDALAVGLGATRTTPRRDLCPDCGAKRQELVVAPGRFYCEPCGKAGEQASGPGAPCDWCGRPIPGRNENGRPVRIDAHHCGKRHRQASWRFGERGPDRPAIPGSAPASFAYADPPYPGMSEDKYGDHPDFDGEVDHASLLEQLLDEYPDGWALSTSPKTLQQVLALCPPGVHVGSWVFSVPPHGGTKRPRTAWEPVIFCGGRSRPPGAPPLLNWLYAPIPKWRDYPGGVIGMKPPELSWWIFDVLGAQVGDELADLFPGSGAVARAWQRYQACARRGEIAPARGLGDVSEAGRRRGRKRSPSAAARGDASSRGPSDASSADVDERHVPGQINVYDLLEEAA